MKITVKFFNAQRVLDPFSNVEFEGESFSWYIDQNDNLIILKELEEIAVFADGRWAEVHIE